MRIIVMLASVLLLTSVVIVSSPQPAQAATYTGWVVHVSSTNIKCKEQSGTETTFALAPSFDQVFSSDGKTTYQMSNLKPGTHVKIEYNSVLSQRYANKITVSKP